MSEKFSVFERKVIATQPLDQLIATTRASGITAIGVNHRLLLNEFAERFDLPTDAVSIALVRNKNPKDPSQGCDVWHWGVWTENRVDAYKAMPGRSWKMGSKSNFFTAESENDPKIFDRLNELFSKTVVITERGFRIEEGEKAPVWTNPLIYKMSDSPLRVNMAEVLDGFFEFRPNDKPRAIAVHGEFDAKYRTLFDESLPARREDLEYVEMRTRHEMLIFRLGLPEGPRYLVYSAVNNSPLEVLFPDTSTLDLRLSQFKEAQLRFAVPLIESASLPPTDGRKALMRHVIGSQDSSNDLN